MINAAGPWSKFVAESIGLELPLRSLREQDTIIESKSILMPATPLSNAIEPTYMRPLNKNGYVIAKCCEMFFVEMNEQSASNA